MGKTTEFNERDGHSAVPSWMEVDFEEKDEGNEEVRVTRLYSSQVMT